MSYNIFPNSVLLIILFYLAQQGLSRGELCIWRDLATRPARVQPHLVLERCLVDQAVLPLYVFILLQIILLFSEGVDDEAGQANIAD